MSNIDPCPRTAKRLAEMGLVAFLEDQRDCWAGNEDGGDTENASYYAALVEAAQAEVKHRGRYRKDAMRYRAMRVRCALVTERGDEHCEVSFYVDMGNLMHRAKELDVLADQMASRPINRRSKAVPECDQ